MIISQYTFNHIGACPNCNTIWNSSGYSTYSGGDASDIRIGGISLSNRVIVAGGRGSAYIERVLDGSTIAEVQTGNGKIIISLYARNTIVLERNNKFYIHDKNHFDIHTKTFKEVTTDEAISFPKDFEYTYDI